MVYYDYTFYKHQYAFYVPLKTDFRTIDDRDC